MKKIKNKENKIEIITDPRQTETVVCHECKHTVERRFSQLVVESGMGLKTDMYYCQMHRKNYDLVDFSIGAVYFKNEQIEVDEQGISLQVKSLRELLEEAISSNKVLKFIMLVSIVIAVVEFVMIQIK